MADSKTKQKRVIQVPIGYAVSYIYIHLFIIAAIILSFIYVSRDLSLGLSCFWVIYSITTLRHRIQAALPLLFIVICYERPVVDFGLGIIGTIKLFDIYALSLLVSYLARSTKTKVLTPKLRFDSLTKALLLLVLISIVSGVINFFLHRNSDFEVARLSLYYALKMIEYFAIFIIIYSIPQSAGGVKRALGFLVLSLSFVGLFAILQGFGVVANQYYTSYSGTFSYIHAGWAIGTLGPNHTHLGIYTAIGLIFSLLAVIDKFKPMYLIAMPFLLGGLYLSHSAVGVAIILLFSVMLLLTTGGAETKIKLAIPMLLIMLSLGLYFSGSIGGGESGHERTKAKFELGANSEVIVRAFVRPYVVLKEAYSEKPLGLFWGYGFRAPDLNSSNVPRTGDNNYFSVLVETGLIGFFVFIILLYLFGQRLILANNISRDKYVKLLNRFSLLIFICLTIAMFSQEILWPLHSRGNTMIFILTLFILPAICKNAILAPRSSTPRGNRSIGQN